MIYDQIRRIFNENNGIVRTADVTRSGIPYYYLDKLIREEKVLRIKRGIYQWIGNGEKNEVEIIFRLFPQAVLYVESALYYYGYTDRTPDCWHLAVKKDINKRKSNITYPVIKLYYIEPNFLKIGVTEGHINSYRVNVFDRDKTICDILRYSNKLDREIVNKAIKSYINDPKKNLARLLDYSKQLRVYKKVKLWIGVWL